jgi:protein-L-isoaspartate(D-aspartate) O-methyltransferase
MGKEFDALIAQIQAETRLSRELTGLSVIAPEVVAALRATPRRNFVPPGMQPFAYANRPLPLSFGQTISQPFIVALMTQMLAPDAGKKVLEIGAGSGYQAAVLARLVKQVISVEIIPELAETARQRLRQMAIDNVEIHCADGYLGWPDDAPYDGIIVTACTPKVPPALIEQLRAGGRLLLPVGEPHGYQELRLVEKSADGTLDSRFVLPVAFVPLTRAGGSR